MDEIPQIWDSTLKRTVNAERMSVDASPTDRSTGRSADRSADRPADRSVLVGKSVAALVFDFDGLILDTEAAEFTSIAAVFAENGARLDRDRWTAHIGMANPPGFWLDWLEADLGRPVNRDWLWLEQRQRNDLQVARLTVLPGVQSLLTEAAAAGVPCAVASSANARWVKPHLDRLGLLDAFATVVTQEDAPNAKPAPDLYFVALDRLGISTPDAHRAVALEDSRNGSLAAVAAGLTCVVCPNGLTAGMDTQHAHLHVSSLAELSLQALSLAMREASPVAVMSASQPVR